jgi:predicted acylesterase/phospholipase RssA
VRGLVTLGILKRIEQTLAPRYPGKPEEFRLCHYFDLIAGTSTGAIIAAALVLGMSVDEISTIYNTMSEDVFQQTTEAWWRKLAGIPGGVFEEVFDAAVLERRLKAFLADMKLGSQQLKTGLMICAKRIDTASPWVLTNCPRSAYWESPKKEWRPNKDYDLWRLIRASSAAPMYFEPVGVAIADKDDLYGEETGDFVDGAVAGLNNPSLQAYLTATLEPYGLCWPSGRDHLLMVSVGTGWWRNRQDTQTFLRSEAWRKAMTAMVGMIQDTSQQTILTLQAISNPRKPWHINGEVKGLSGQLCHGQEMLSFQRYDASLERDNVERLFGAAHASPEIMSKLRDIGSIDRDILKRLYAIGYASGRVATPGVDGIEPNDFPAIFDPPGFNPATKAATAAR